MNNELSTDVPKLNTPSSWVVSSDDKLARDAPATDDNGNSRNANEVDFSLDTSHTSNNIATNKITDFAFSSKGFHVSNLNVRHIVPKIGEIRILMSNESSPHILGLCETFLRENNRDSQISIDGYNFFRKDRSETQEKHGGGLLFYFKESLNVKRRTDIEISNIETLWAEIMLPNAKPFLISSVYRPPSTCSDWISLFEEELSVAQTTGLEYILIGDFNIDIALSSNTKWMNLVQLFDLTQLVSTPTRVTQTSSTIIDHTRGYQKVRALMP